jgi:acylphosphatase
MKRIQAVVCGRVQGVSFRYYTQREAQRLGVTGWVRNQPDGSVMTVAEAADETLDTFIQFLHQGPPSARVTQVDLEWFPATGEFSEFTTRYFYE